MKALLAYAGSGAVLVGLAAWGVATAVHPAAARAVWWAAGMAYGIQVLAFGALILLRGRGTAFFAAWGGGTVLRLGAVGVVGLWLVRTPGTSPAALLLSLAGFLFGLLLLEPVFFRIGLRSE